MKITLIMTTKDGVSLFFNKKEGFLSSNPEAVRTALKEDINSKDLIASKMARHIWIQAELSGGIKELSRLF